MNAQVRKGSADSKQQVACSGTARGNLAGHSWSARRRAAARACIVAADTLPVLACLARWPAFPALTCRDVAKVQGS